MTSAQYFAPYYRRFAAVAVDYLITFFGTAGIQSYVLEPMGIELTGFQPIFFVFAIAYLTLSWWSPLSATPAQYLLRMRVVRLSGQPLGPGRAAARSLLLIGGVVGAMTLFEVPKNPNYLLLAVPVMLVLFAGVFTPNRQSGHDYLVRSIVVMKDALETTEARAALRDYVACNDGGLLKLRRPTALEVTSAVVAVGLPVFGLYNVALSQFDRELRARMSYAYQETRELRVALQEVYLYEERWGSTAADLGTPTRVDYPDGGYYELEEDGSIRIQFTVIPKLKKVQLVITPDWNDGELDWQCRAEGEIAQAVLPSRCRDYE